MACHLPGREQKVPLRKEDGMRKQEVVITAATMHVEVEARDDKGRVVGRRNCGPVVVFESDFPDGFAAAIGEYKQVKDGVSQLKAEIEQDEK